MTLCNLQIIIIKHFKSYTTGKRQAFQPFNFSEGLFGQFACSLSCANGTIFSLNDIQLNKRACTEITCIYSAFAVIKDTKG